MPDDEIVFDGIPIPYGLKGAVAPDTTEDDESIINPDFSEAFSDDEGYDSDETSDEYEVDYTDDDQVDDGLGVPNTVNIVSQTFRTAPDGTQVVDCVIEIEDVDDAVRYEVRVNP